MSAVRHARRACIAKTWIAGLSQGNRRNLSASLPPLPNSLGNQRLGRRRLEICPLPALLPTGPHHLERTVLSAAVLGPRGDENRRDALSVRAMPLQLREFPAVSGENVVEETAAANQAAGADQSKPGSLKQKLLRSRILMREEVSGSKFVFERLEMKNGSK